MGDKRRCRTGGQASTTATERWQRGGGKLGVQPSPALKVARRCCLNEAKAGQRLLLLLVEREGGRARQAKRAPLIASDTVWDDFIIVSNCWGDAVADHGCPIGGGSIC